MEKTSRLQDIRNGAIIERVNREIQRVADDIADPNKVAKNKRSVTLKLTFEPTEDGRFGKLTATVDSTLGKQHEEVTSLYFGVDPTTRQGIASENSIPTLPLGEVIDTTGGSN